MAPSLQTQDPSLFTLGTAGSAQSSETQSSSLLFKLGSMKPPKRPLRTVTPGDGFGVGKLGREEPDSGSKYAPPASKWTLSLAQSVLSACTNYLKVYFYISNKLFCV